MRICHHASALLGGCRKGGASAPPFQTRREKSGLADLERHSLCSRGQIVVLAAAGKAGEFALEAGRQTGLDEHPLPLSIRLESKEGADDQFAEYGADHRLRGHGGSAGDAHRIVPVAAQHFMRLRVGALVGDFFETVEGIQSFLWNETSACRVFNRDAI